MNPAHLGPDLIIEVAARHYGFELPFLFHVLCWFPTVFIAIGAVFCRR